MTSEEDVPYEVRVPTADSMRDLGAAIGRLLTGGDVVLLTGPLGAGKTTFAQGVGRGLGVRGHVASPTFVIARVHESADSGPALVHVDAYRLGGVAELDDLDLDADVDRSVTLVEWGEGMAEGLSDDRLEIDIDRHSGTGPEDELRVVRIRPTGARWAMVDLGPGFELRPDPPSVPRSQRL